MPFLLSVSILRPKPDPIGWFLADTEALASVWFRQTKVGTGRHRAMSALDDSKVDGARFYRKAPATRAMRARRHWRGLPLHIRFAAAGSLVVLIGMLIVGWWVSREIEDSVTRNSAISTALYMESFIAPMSQELSQSDSISPDTAERLRELFKEPHLAERIASVKLWKEGGLVAFSTDPALIGMRFEPSASLKAAWAGHLSAEFDELDHPADYIQRQDVVPYLEVYNPIHSIYSGKIIAVAEFYQVATELEQDLFFARLNSWLIVAVVSIVMFLLLFGIVRQGSRTIERQNAELTRQFQEVTEMSEQNTKLRRRIQAAALRSGEHNERFLRRISAELHDGPAQALALAALRLDSAFRTAGIDPVNADISVIRSSLDDAMREIRSICRGLSLPEIEGMPLPDVLHLAAETHERRSGTTVDLNFDKNALTDCQLDRPQLICIYRFVQEGLNNAFRHGQGCEQAVSCRIEDNALTVSVRDGGPGFDPSELETETTRLGLRGLRERVESTGGRFFVSSSAEAGTRLEMSLPMGD